VNLSWEKLLKIEFIIYTLHQILFDNKSEEFAGQACSRCLGNAKCFWNFGRKLWRRYL